MQRIIYKQDDGTIAVIIPAPGCPLSIEEIALKDVPTGKPYKIVNVSEIPTDREFRNAWTVDDSELTDGVGADYGVGSENIVSGYDKNNNPIIS